MKIIEKFKDKINGFLSGFDRRFDRMIIKGHILQLFSDSEKRYFLSQENVLLKDYGDYAESWNLSMDRENVSIIIFIIWIKNLDLCT